MKLSKATWIFWSYLELSKSIWSYLELSGAISEAIWSYLELSGATWSYLELSGAIKSCLELSEAVWNYLELSGEAAADRFGRASGVRNPAQDCWALDMTSQICNRSFYNWALTKGIPTPCANERGVHPPPPFVTLVR